MIELSWFTIERNQTLALMTIMRAMGLHQTEEHGRLETTLILIEEARLRAIYENEKETEERLEWELETWFEPSEELREEQVSKMHAAAERKETAFRNLRAYQRSHQNVRFNCK